MSQYVINISHYSNSTLITKSVCIDNHFRKEQINKTNSFTHANDGT